MAVKPKVLDQVLDAYRDQDLHECIRLVRTLVEAAPEATAPRQLLAALFASTGNGRQALSNYRRLLPQAVARGEVMRAIAFQKQIDLYEQPEALVPGRWGALQKQLRDHGLPFVTEAPGAHERPWTEAQLLALPRAWFERIAAETRLDILGMEQCSLDVEAGTVWEVLSGRMRWSFALPDGRASAEALASEGDAVHVDPGLARTASVTLVPELPAEALCFAAGLARDLKLALSAGLHVTGAVVPGLTDDARTLMPIVPRRREDLAESKAPPATAAATADGSGPARDPVPAAEPGAVEPPVDDTGDWPDFGALPLPGSGAAEPPEATAPRPAEDSPEGASTEDAPATGGGAPPDRDRVLDLPGPDAEPEVVEVERGGGERIEVPDDEPLEAAPPGAGASADDRPAHRSPGTREPDDAGAGDSEIMVERRRNPRVSVSVPSRIAVLRLGGTSASPLEGRLSDLSTSGFSVRFEGQELDSSRTALADALVAVDLELPGPQGPLRVAAQVRWLEADEPGNEARLGVEFVLLTEPDRRRIAGTLARAALAAREQERAAA